MKKINYFISNTIGGYHTELKEGYLIMSNTKRLYGVSGSCGAWTITDIMTGCIVGRCERLNQVNETVAPKEKEIERVINETETFNEIIAEIYLSYKITKIRWFYELVINRGAEL